MAVLGLSLILASVVVIWFRQPAWLPNWFRRVAAQVQAGSEKIEGETTSTAAPLPDPVVRDTSGAERPHAESDSESDAESDADAEAGQITPKASVSQPVPTFSLSESDVSTTTNSTLKSVAVAAPGRMPPLIMPNSRPGSMAPPPHPSTITRQPATTPSSSSTRLSPLPQRGPLASASASASSRAPGTSTLAPPPMIAGRPAKPSRKVVLEPGHSPLDWARLSATSDLRGLPAGMPGGYLRVGPAQLRRQNGRRGADAWMALGGRVYNVQPYADFHPGGVGELMRGAGKDGGSLFNEAHPWVNYEGMLANCLIGRLVPDGDEREGDGDGTSGAMEEMD